MGEAFKLMGVVGADIGGAKKNLREVQRDLQTTRGDFDKTGRAGKSMFASLTGGGGARGGGGGSMLSSLAEMVQMIPGLGQVAGAVAKIGGAVAGGVKAGMDYNRVIEENSIAFEVMLGKGGDVKGLLDDLAKKAEQSPFEFPEIIATTKRMMAFGFSVDEIKARLITFSDTASAMGVPMERIIMALGQMRQKGKVSFEEMNQLVEAGVPAWRYLADEMARTDKKFAALTDDKKIAKLQKLAETGKLNARGAEQAIARGMQAQFGGIGSRVATETASGIEANLSDVLTRLAGTASKGGFQAYKQTLRGLLTVANSDVAAGFAEGANGVTVKALGAFNDSINTFKEEGAIAGFGGIAKQIIGAQETVVVGAMNAAGLSSAAGLAKGMYAGEKQVVDAGVHMAQSLVGAVKGTDGLDINSPAKALIPLGLSAWEGVEKGFMDGAAAGMPRISALVSQLGQTPGLQRAGGGGGAAARRRAENEMLLGDPRIQAAMDTIGAGEGTFDRRTGERIYNKMFAGHRFALGSGEGAFRRTRFFDPKKGRMNYTTATGFGQYIGSTWDGASRRNGGLNIGNPRDQELAMVDLMRTSGMAARLLGGDTRGALRAGSAEWASLPGSNSKQPQQRIEEALRLFEQRLGVHASGAGGTGAGAGLGFSAGNAPATVDPANYGRYSNRNRGGGGGAPSPAAFQELGRAADNSAVAIRATNEVLLTTDQTLRGVEALTTQQRVKMPEVFTATAVAAQSANVAIEQTIALLEKEGGAIDKILNDIGDGFEGIFGDGLTRIAEDGMKAAGAAMLLEFVNLLQRMAAQALAANLAGAIFGPVGENGQRGGGILSKLIGWGVGALGIGGAGGGAGGGSSLLTAAANLPTGGRFNLGGSNLTGLRGGSLFHRATGGRVNAGHAYTVGERGSEMFIPNTSGTIVPHDQLGGGRVQIQMHVHGVKDARSFQEAEGQIGRRAGLAAQRALRRYN